VFSVTLPLISLQTTSQSVAELLAILHESEIEVGVADITANSISPGGDTNKIPILIYMHMRKNNKYIFYSNIYSAPQECLEGDLQRWP
jgi:hypothetical protein